MPEVRRRPGATIRCEEVFTATCDTCRWVSLQWREQAAAVDEWRKHFEREHPLVNDGDAPR